MRRHRLAADTTADSVLSAVESMLVLHASDPATVYLSVLARAPAVTIADIARTLYDERLAVRMLAMRRTLFIVPRDLVAAVHHGASVGVAKQVRSRLVKTLQTTPTEPELPDDLDAWLTDVEGSTEAALIRRGEALANQLSTDEPRLRTALLPRTDKAYDVRRTITTNVLTLMACEGRIIRSQPRGDWTSRQHSWQPASAWFPDGIAELDAVVARADLVERWLRTFGPATEADIAWWGGWALGATRTAIARLDTTAVDLDGVAGLAMADDLAAEAEVAPTAVLLPALDPTPMGWKQRGWFLGEHRAALFDTYGNIGPSLWWDGVIVGGWAVTSSGAVAYRLLSDVGREAAAAVEAAAGALEPRLEGVVVTPTFRTPLERALSQPA
jgi:hypothetical protein